jgi:prolyl-tRNA synthetase
VQSYRDLPILINQWANVVRWEMRPRVFLRTAEFLWQEGHTAHETEAEARQETRQMLDVYATFAREWLALPVYTGEKSAGERFPGADQTLCIEAMVQDRKAIQAGTSHFLGQNFAKASGIQFVSRENKQEFAWTTSWGVSTRLIGTVIMAHGDDDGVILPPRIAPSQVVIVPVVPKPEMRDGVFAACDALAAKLRAQTFGGEAIRVEIDKRDLGGGQKSWEWIKRGVPVRVEIGPRDLEKGTVAVARRDRGHKEKAFPTNDEFVSTIAATLQEIHDTLISRATKLRDENTVKIDSKEDFVRFFTSQRKEKPEIHGGFALAHWDGSAEVEAQIKEELKVTIRCIPDNAPTEEGKCVWSGRPSTKRVLFAKSY